MTFKDNIMALTTFVTVNKIEMRGAGYLLDGVIVVKLGKKILTHTVPMYIDFRSSRRANITMMSGNINFKNGRVPLEFDCTDGAWSCASGILTIAGDHAGKICTTGIRFLR